MEGVEYIKYSASPSFGVRWMVDGGGLVVVVAVEVCTDWVMVVEVG